MELSMVFAVLGLLFKATTVYFAAVALRWMFIKRKRWPQAAPRTRFAVVIAARNEEAVIGRLVKSLMEQDYPRELFDVYVAPNNCTDDTAGAAFQAGAQILFCDYPVRQKGDALRQAFCQLDGRGYDAFVVFDADNVVDAQYLRRTNDAFCAGAQVVKGRQMAMNPKASWVAGCYDIYFSAFDLFFNRPRANGGLSSKLVGTGFAVHRTVLEQLGGWNTQTMAEDAEFSAQCARAGIRICWQPEAITYDEEPVEFAVSLRQRKRWCSGVVQVGRRMLPELSRSSGRLAWDMLCFLLTPQLAPVSALLMAFSQLCAGNAAVSPAALAVSAAGYWIGCTGLAACLLLIGRPAGRGNWRAAAMFPLFMASWLPLQLLALFHRTTVWREIPHTGGKNQDFA